MVWLLAVFSKAKDGMELPKVSKMLQLTEDEKA